MLKTGLFPTPRQLRATGVLLLAVLLQSIHAAASPADDQRQLYRNAMQALERGDSRPFLRQRDHLASYPLYPYLELAELRTRLADHPETEVADFLQRHGPDLPAVRLRAAWLQSLASRQRWSDYLRFHETATGSDEERCRHGWALLQTGRQSEADAAASLLWSNPRSMPSACDGLFHAWMSRGNPGNELAWQRFAAAMNAGQPALARYVMRYMDAAYGSDAALFLEVADKPSRVREHQRFDGGNPRHARILEFGLARFAALDASAARRTFEHHARGKTLQPEALQKVAPRIANALSGDSAEAALQWIIGLDPALRGDSLTEDAARYALRGADWDPVLAALDLMPAHLAGTPRWSYWRARSTQAYSASTGEARAIYAGLSETRSYYGFLAADRIGSAYAMQHQPLPVDSGQLRNAANLPCVRRAREFDLLGDSIGARREWFHCINHADPRQRLAAARLAAGWGWAQLAINTLILAEEWNDLELRFPLLYAEQFEQAARQQRLDRNWLFAIARQESTFNPGARSPAGALGLMQLMPATAQMTARSMGLGYRGNQDLLDPARNVAIGSHYMRMMMDDFQQNRILAAAAYNAGPNRVRQWLRRHPPHVDHDRFVETIPFGETRQYVQNVLAFAVIYAWLQGRSVTMVEAAEQRINNPYAGPLPGAG
jgi:soluble lytic murein transglycosylase